MSRNQPSPQEVVNHVLEAWRGNASDHAVIARLVQLGVPGDEAATALDLVRSGIVRAGIIDAGLPSNQISSDVDDHPVFRAAVDAGLANASKTPRATPLDKSKLLSDLKSSDVSLRRTAAYELGNRNDAGATAALLAAIDDADNSVRVYAIQSLSRLRSRDAVQPLCKILTSGAPTIVTTNAIKALADIRDRDCVPALIEATRHDDAFVRQDAAWALGELGDSRAIPALEALLADHCVPVERNALGLTTKSSIYSVADQAQRSIHKLAALKTGRISSWMVTAASVIILAIVAYGYFAKHTLSSFGLMSGVAALVAGISGLAYFGRKQPS